MTVSRIGRISQFENPGSSFIGRKRELATLATALQQTRSGLGSIFLLSGEAGVGKTLLVREFSSYARTEGAKVLEGRAYVRFRDALPFGVWKQILSDHPDRPDGSPSHFLPVDPASVTASSAQLQVISDHQTNPELFERTAHALVEHARTQPLVLVLDDLHAADPLSLQAFRVLSRDLSRLGTMVLGVYRDSEIKRFREFADLLLDPLIRDSKRISLAAFDDRETREFAESRTSSPLQEEALAALHSLTGGNPRLLEIALRRHLLGETSPRSQCRQGGLLRAEIEAHLEHLSEQSREVLSTASLVGVEFGLASLFHVLEREPSELLDSLHEAEQSGLLKRTETPGTYRFRQTLVQEILYAEFSGTRRAHLHERFGQVLESLHQGDDAYVEKIAHHFYEAALLGCADRAADYCTRAAAYACSASRVEDALRYYQMALVALELEGSNPEAIRNLKIRLDNARLRTESPASGSHPSETFGDSCKGENTQKRTVLSKPASPKLVTPIVDADATSVREIAGAQPPIADLVAEPSQEIHPNTFRREGDYWTLIFEGKTLRLRHTNGLLFVAYLLEHPDCDLHVAQLAALVPAARTSYLEGLYVSHSDRERLGMHVISGKDNNPLLDSTAKAEYRRRIDELRDALEQAQAFNDSGKAAELEKELEFVALELSRAVGAGGRSREHQAEDERARVNVTNAVRTVTAKIFKEHPSFGRYLRTTIRTGRFCSYHPDPRSIRPWQF